MNLQIFHDYFLILGAYFNEEREKLRRRCGFGEKRLDQNKENNKSSNGFKKGDHQQQSRGRAGGRGSHRGRGQNFNSYRNGTKPVEDDYEDHDSQENQRYTGNGHNRGKSGRGDYGGNNGTAGGENHQRHSYSTFKMFAILLQNLLRSISPKANRKQIWMRCHISIQCFAFANFQFDSMPKIGDFRNLERNASESRKCIGLPNTSSMPPNKIHYKR